MPIDSATEKAIRARLGKSEFAKWFGIEFASFDEGAAELRLKLEPHHLNPGGIAHGGVIATLLDGSIGLALRTLLGPESAHVTVHLDVQYLSMAREGTLVAKGTAVHSGSRAAYGEASLYGDDGKLVAKASATFLRL